MIKKKANEQNKKRIVRNKNNNIGRLYNMKKNICPPKKKITSGLADGGFSLNGRSKI